MQMNQGDTACPAHDELKNFLAGKLDEKRSLLVEQHLEHCHECESSVDALESEPDTYVDALKADTKPEMASLSFFDSQLSEIVALADSRNARVAHLPCILGSKVGS